MITKMEYLIRWSEHVDNFNLLRLSTDDPKLYLRIKKLQEGLQVAVGEVADELELDDFFLKEKKDEE